MNNKTNSSWIYSELLMSKYMRKRPSERKIYSANRTDGYFHHNDLIVEYDVDVSHLFKLSLDDLVRASLHLNGVNGTIILDELYRMKNLI